MTSRRITQKEFARVYANYDKYDREYTLEELTPLRATYYHCKLCTTDPSLSVRDCGGEGGKGFHRCELYKYRMGRRNGDTEKDVLKAIKKYAEYNYEVKLGCGPAIPLAFYQDGKNPKRQWAAKKSDNLGLKKSKKQSDSTTNTKQKANK